MQTAINLFTRSDLEERYTLSQLLELCADAGYDGVEFLHRFPDTDLETVRKTVDSTGLGVPGAHLGPFIGLDEQAAEIDQMIESYAAVDCSTLSISIGERLLRIGRTDR